MLKAEKAAGWIPTKGQWDLAPDYAPKGSMDVHKSKRQGDRGITQESLTGIIKGELGQKKDWQQSEVLRQAVRDMKAGGYDDSTIQGMFARSLNAASGRNGKTLGGQVRSFEAGVQ